MATKPTIDQIEILLKNPPKHIPLRVGQRFIHFRTKEVYVVLHLATDTETGKPCVVYQNEKDLKVYSRNRELFEGCVGLGIRRFTRIPKTLKP